MAFGRGMRTDGRRSGIPSPSSFCKTPAVVVFVALCLVGVWMFTSSNVIPAEISIETKSELSGSSELGISDEEPVNLPEEVQTTNDAVDSAAHNSDKEHSEAQKAKKTMPVKPLEFGDTNEKVGEAIKENPEENFGGAQVDAGNEVEGKAQNVEDDENEKKSEEASGATETEGEKNTTDQDENSDGDAGDRTDQAQTEKNNEMVPLKSKETFPDAAQSELLNETVTANEAWSSQDTESKNEQASSRASSPSSSDGQSAYQWKLCNVTAGADYIPCLDNEQAIKKLRSTKHYEHRERHCPEEAPTCLVPLPDGYKRPIEWPMSRDKVWYHNVPHTQLADFKGHQNWVKISGEYLTFPGGGTQFKNGALHYIDTIQKSFPDISWGRRTRVVLDVGCGVASFGGYLFERDVLTMSFAPKDEHEAQVQFALERGIPAISAVMGTKRLPFPSGVFDAIHCARCRVPWHIEGGKLLLELNRLLRPGGYFLWSATPVYQKLDEDVQIWNAMTSLTKGMCWKMVNKTKDRLNEVAMAIYRKPTDNKCYDKRTDSNPPLCQGADDPNAAWNVSLQACLHSLSVDPVVRGSRWPEQWPERLANTPYWLNNSQVGVYGKPAANDFQADYEHWKRVVNHSYVNGMGIDWSRVRNVMDMQSVYGGFAAALRDMQVWVMNIVPITSPDTLPIIYERGLFGLYHDWCESFSTYPRTYDLLHADHLFSQLKKRCNLVPVIAEVDRILRPEGTLIVRDDVDTINEIVSLARSLNWEIRLTYFKNKEGLLCVQKTMWRPTEVLQQN